MAIQDLLRSKGLTQGALAEAIGMAESTLSQKLNGSRRWTVEEAALVLTFVREKCDPAATFEQLFSEAA